MWFATDKRLSFSSRQEVPAADATKLSAELMPKLGECTRVQGHDYTRVTFGVTRVAEGAHFEREKLVKLLLVCDLAGFAILYS